MPPDTITATITATGESSQEAPAPTTPSPNSTPQSEIRDNMAATVGTATPLDTADPLFIEQWGSGLSDIASYLTAGPEKFELQLGIPHEMLTPNLNFFPLVTFPEKIQAFFLQANFNNQNLIAFYRETTPPPAQTGNSAAGQSDTTEKFTRHILATTGATQMYAVEFDWKRGTASTIVVRQNSDKSHSVRVDLEQHRGGDQRVGCNLQQYIPSGREGGTSTRSSRTDVRRSDGRAPEYIERKTASQDDVLQTIIQAALDAAHPQEQVAAVIFLTLGTKISLAENKPEV